MSLDESAGQTARAIGPVEHNHTDSFWRWPEGECPRCDELEATRG